MNADEIVKALRHCYQEDIHGCEDCPLNESDLCYEANLELSAADLIESLLAQLAEKETTLNGTYISMDAHEREVKKLKAEIGYEQDRIDCRNPICNSNREGMYRKCAELEELLDAAIAGQETLQKALAESQRRERAAAEDLTYFAGAITTGEPCSRCIYNPDDMGCELDGSQYDDDGECHFTWRGPQEGELNGETDNPD